MQFDLGGYKRGPNPWLGLALFLGLWLSWATTAARAESSPRVVVVLSDGAAAYHEVAEAFVAALAGKYPVQFRMAGELSASEIRNLNGERILIVPIGMRALRAIHDPAGHNARVLALLVPRAALESLGDAGVGDSAVYIDQPASRSLVFAKLLLPQAVKIGVVVSPDAVVNLRGLAGEATRQHLELVVEKVADQQEVARALQRMLPEIDVLLLVPDSQVVNENTVRQILMASYRRRVPVLGFSRGLANAGAVASLVSSPGEIGRQGGLLARQWNPVSGWLPAARHAERVELIFNRQVARSLDIDLPADEAATETWRRRLD
ncbi:ABC transporter substrate-binding protein [Parasulfuritortus cantonensis]|nr:ABC transporter substrate binding protein [Parasulfuritortus cantonensis]